MFVDVEPPTFTHDVDRLERPMMSRTRAILPLHRYGQPADMDPVLEVGRRQGVTVSEDGAQVYAAYKSGWPGSLGDMARFSFYPGENREAYGEAGMVVQRTIASARIACASCVTADRIDAVTARTSGIARSWRRLQATRLRTKCAHRPRWTARRRQLAALDDVQLADDAVTRPTDVPYARHVFDVDVVTVPDRNGDFPVSERAAAAVLSIGLVLRMTEPPIDIACEALRGCGARAYVG